MATAESFQLKEASPKGIGTPEDARSINSYLKQVEAKIFEHYRDQLAGGKLITADGLKNAYLGFKPDQYSPLHLIEYHNTHLKDTLEWGTLKNYMTTQKYVKEFLKNRVKTSEQRPKLPVPHQHFRS
jgi:integrase/recombinase XerD